LKSNEIEDSQAKETGLSQQQNLVFTHDGRIVAKGLDQGWPTSRSPSLSWSIAPDFALD